MSLKDDLELNKPRRTPGHATKSHVVKTNVNGKPKMIRFGEQGASTAGAPSSNDSAADKAKRKSFKARHASNIAKGPASAAYWADRVKWDKGGPVNFRGDQPVRPGLPFLNTAADVTADTLSGMLGPIVGSAYSLGNQYFTDKGIDELNADRDAVNAALNYTPRTEEGQAASDYAMGKLGEGVTFLAEKYNENRDSLGPIPGMIDYGVEQYNTLDPETQFAIENSLTVGEVLPIGKAAGMAKRGVQGAVDTRRINRAADLVPDESEYLALQDRLEEMGARQNMVGYHGSPYQFSKFDHSKMGTGEGNQAYGWGTYLAEKKDTGVFYANVLSNSEKRLENITEVLYDFAPEVRGEAADAFDTYLSMSYTPEDAAETFVEVFSESIDNAQEVANKFLRAVDEGKIDLNTTGSLYEVDLPDKKIAQMLDWDKPVNKKMQNLLNELAVSSGRGDKWLTPQESWSDYTGKQAYDNLGDYFTNNEEASKFLSDNGIPGIKYLDEESRFTGEGTRNFVVFDESDMTVLTRNGEKVNEPPKPVMFKDVEQPELTPDQLSRSFKDGEITNYGRNIARKRAATDMAGQTEKVKKLSEVLGDMDIEGKARLVATQSDRTGIKDGAGPGYPLIGRQYSEMAKLYQDEFGKAPAPKMLDKNGEITDYPVWAVDAKGTAASLRNNLMEEQSLLIPMIGAPGQLRTNKEIFKKLKKEFMSGVKANKLTKEQADKININLEAFTGLKLDIRDPSSWVELEKTFDGRGALADIMSGKTPQAIASVSSRKKWRGKLNKKRAAAGLEPLDINPATVPLGSRKGQIFDYEKILEDSTESVLLGADTFSVGPTIIKPSRLRKSETMPDAHPGFKEQLMGELASDDIFTPVPLDVAIPSFTDYGREIHMRYGPNKRPFNSSAWGMNARMGYPGQGLPSQVVDEDYLKYLQDMGFAEGGEVEAAEEVVEYNADRISQIARDIKGYAGGGFIERAIEKVIKKGAKALGFDDDRQLQISADATDLTKQIDPSKEVVWIHQGNPITTDELRSLKTNRDKIGLSGDEETFDAVNHALFGYESGENPISAFAGQAKEVYQGAKQAVKGKEWRTELKDMWNNSWGINQRKQNLTRPEFDAALAQAFKDTKGRMERGEALRMGQDIILNPKDLAQFAEGGPVEDIYQPEGPAQVFGDVVMDTVSGVAGPIAAAAASLGNQYFTDKSIDQLEAEKAAMNEAMNYSPRTAGGRAINQGAMNLLDKGMTAGIDMATSYPGPVKDLVESRLAEYGLDKYQDLDPETKFALGNVLEASEALPVGMANRGIRNAIDTRKINTAAGNVPDDSAYLDLQDRLEEMGARQTSVKEKGGNWLQGDATRSSRAAFQLERFKVQPILAPGVLEQEFQIAYPGISADESRVMLKNLQDMAIEDSNFMSGEAGNRPLYRILQAQYPEVYDKVLTSQYVGAKELNNWIDNTLSRYVETEMGTPGDPVKAMAGRGDPLHVTRDALNYNPRMYDSKYDPEQREIQQYTNLINEGLDFQSLPLAQTWEGASDRAFEQLPAYQFLTRKGAQTVIDNPWLSKIPPETPINFLSSTGELVNDLGFQELTSELYRAMTPRRNAALPANLRLDPDKLKKLTVPQAIERVAKIQEWKVQDALAKEKTLLMENLKNSTRMTDEKLDFNFADKKGGTWVDIPDASSGPDAMKSCTTIGKSGGWCTQEEENALNYGSGSSRLTAMLDSDGRPHLQIEQVVVKSGMYADIDLAIEAGANGTSPNNEVVDIVGIKPRSNFLDNAMVTDYVKKDPQYINKLSESVKNFLNKTDSEIRLGNINSEELEVFGLLDTEDRYTYGESWEDFFNEDANGISGSDRLDAAFDVMKSYNQYRAVNPDGAPRIMSVEESQQYVSDRLDEQIKKDQNYEEFAKGGAVNAKYDADKINKIAKSIMAENFAEGGPAIYNPSRINEIANRILQEA